MLENSFQSQLQNFSGNAVACSIANKVKKIFHKGGDKEHSSHKIGSYIEHKMEKPTAPSKDKQFEIGKPFDFSKEMYEKINKEIFPKYPSTAYGKKSAVLPLLHLAQEQLGGFITLYAMKKISQLTEVDEREIYQVATFYAMFNRHPVGKYQIHVCKTTPCQIMGSDDIIHAIEKSFGIKLGQTTADGMFTLGEMECMGCCVNAPMIAVADFSNPPNYSYDYYEDLTPEKAVEILNQIKKGKKPTPGPQNGRKNSQGKVRTSLKGKKE